MKRVENILFPVDFSERCLAAGPAVASMARRLGANVTLMHAFNMPPGAYQDWYSYLSLVDTKSVQADVERSLHRFLVEQFAGVETRRVLVDREPADAIVWYAETHGMDMIMLPTRGHGRFRSLLLGSVTGKVLHDAVCPVWTEAHTEEDGAPTETKSIVCAVDLSPRTVGVLRWAYGMARDLGAKCHVVYVDEDGTAASGAEAEKTFAGYAAEAGVSSEVEVLSGGVVETVLAVCRSHDADLLVAGRGDIQGALGRLRTRIGEIVRQSSCPVLSV